MNGRKRKAIATLYVVRDVDSIPAFLPLVFQSLYGLVLECHQLIVTRTVNTTKPGSLLLWEIKYNSLGGSWSPIS